MRLLLLLLTQWWHCVGLISSLAAPRDLSTAHVGVLRCPRQQQQTRSWAAVLGEAGVTLSTRPIKHSNTNFPGNSSKMTTPITLTRLPVLMSLVPHASSWRSGSLHCSGTRKRKFTVSCTAVRVLLHRNKAFDASGIRSCNRGVCTELLPELRMQGEAACPLWLEPFCSTAPAKHGEDFSTLRILQAACRL